MAINTSIIWELTKRDFTDRFAGALRDTRTVSALRRPHRPIQGVRRAVQPFRGVPPERDGAAQVVFLGKPVMDIPDHPDILSPGFVDEQAKWDALAACDLLVMPSLHKGLSMALLEAWAVGKPALVNGRYKVL